LNEKLPYSQIWGTKVGPSYKKRRQRLPSGPISVVRNEAKWI